MARKSSNSAEGYMHDAKPGKTLFILERRWGNDGYAFWFKLLEILTASDGHFFSLNDPQATEYFWARMGLREGISGPEILDLLASLGNIDSPLWKQRKVIWCENLVNRLAESVWAKRQRPAPTKPSLDGVISGTEIPLKADIWDRNASNGHENGITGPVVHRVSEGVEGGRDGIPPLSATPSEPQEKEVCTKVDTDISEEITPMMVELQEIYRRATHGETLKLSDGEMSSLLELFRRHPGPSVVAAYKLHQAKKPGKAFAYFLADFPEYIARAPKPAGPPPTRCEYCGADIARGFGHTASCNRPGNANGLPPPESSGAVAAGDFPEAAT